MNTVATLCLASLIVYQEHKNKDLHVELRKQRTCWKINSTYIFPVTNTIRLFKKLIHKKSFGIAKPSGILYCWKSSIDVVLKIQGGIFLYFNTTYLVLFFYILVLEILLKIRRNGTYFWQIRQVTNTWNVLKYHFKYP